MVVRMAMTAVWLNIDEGSVVRTLSEAGEKLGGTDGQVVLDFSSVRRVNPSALQAMEKLAAIAAEKSLKLGLSGVNVDVYKVLKLVKLTPRFSFVN